MVDVAAEHNGQVMLLGGLARGPIFLRAIPMLQLWSMATKFGRNAQTWTGEEF